MPRNDKELERYETSYSNSEYQALLKQFDPSRIHIGQVMDTRNITGNGAIKVWLVGSPYSPEEISKWITVYYTSPFMGSTPDNSNGSGDFASAKKSYGWWATAPDIGNKVLVAFANVAAEELAAYYIGCIGDMNMNHMLPGIAYGQSTAGKQEPITEYNKVVGDQNTKPPFTPLSAGLEKQGLNEDKLRGQSSSSARRESPSRVHGLLTPRGQQLVLDDGYDSSEDRQNWRDNPNGFATRKNAANDPSSEGRFDEVIRFRTRSGAQLMISESSGHIYMINKDGDCWFELNNDGYVDIYSKQDISIRSQGSINIKADKDINLEAVENFNFKVGKDFNLEVVNNLGANVNKFDMCSMLGINLKSSANISLDAAVALNILSAGALLLTGGAPVNIGPGIIIPALAISGVSPAAPIPVCPIKPQIYQLMDGSTKVTSIVQRMPSHEPWPEHSVSIPGYRVIGLSDAEDSNLVKENNNSTGSLNSPPDNPNASSSIPANLNDVSIGNVVENADKPLDLIGTPRAGMTPGLYRGVGYSTDRQPLYEFVRALNSGEMKAPREWKVGSLGDREIKRSEALKLQYYLCAAGVPTIGYGHALKTAAERSRYTGGKAPSDPSRPTISNSDAQALFDQDVLDHVTAFQRSFTTPITQNQFDAVASYLFNCGPGAYKDKWVQAMASGSFQECPNLIMKSRVTGGGSFIPGLVTRRRAQMLQCWAVV